MVDARVDEGACTHGAGFESDGDAAAVKAPCANGLRGFFEGENFCMGGWVGSRFSKIMRGCNYFVITVDYGTNGDFADLCSELSLLECELHHAKITLMCERIERCV